MSIVDGETTGVDQLLTPPREFVPAPRRRRRRAVALLVALALAVTSAAVVVWQEAPTVRHLGDPFASIPAGTRATIDPAAGKAMNILVMGSDSRTSDGDPAHWSPGAQRSDVLMVLHLSSDRHSAQVISIPRDSWVAIPGHGTAKINAAFSYGGTALAVQTVEQLTGVHIDHVAALDFTGFAAITDALGGVQICVPATVSDHLGTVPAGCSTMNGEQALTYVRQRKTLPGGDFDRERRQQNWMRQVLLALSKDDLTKHPLTLAKVVSELASSVETDDGLSQSQMASLALSYASAGTAHVSFLTAPLATPATGRQGSQSVVYLDPSAGGQLWAAVRSDTMSTWVAQHPSDELGNVVR